MEGLITFENFGIVSGNEKYASRKDIQDLYKVPRKTLSDNIDKLREDGLISGAKIRHTAADGKVYNTEVYTLQEAIKIGFRLRSDEALRLQEYAANLLVQKIKDIEEEKRMLELELSYAWNRSDTQDLYR